MSRVQWAVFLALALGLPFLGVIIAGSLMDLSQLYSPYAINVSSVDELPVQSVSWPFSLVLLCFGGIFVLLFLFQFFRNLSNQSPSLLSKGNLPLWGWGGLFSLVFFWYLAWERPIEVGVVEHLTFTFLWASYITFVNSLTFRRVGKCLLIGRPGYIFRLFIFSIPFWWYFEYLNRYVLNWYYFVGDGFHPLEYLLLGSLAFGTVLPAVMSTREYILTFSVIRPGFDDLVKLILPFPKTVSVLLFSASAVSLAMLGVYPQYLYPLLWISPLLLLVSLQTMFGQKHIFSPLGKGNYSSAVASALAALVCGFVWEIWNFHSLPKWVYSVPLVAQYKIFEMPLLGYMGYLPFGLECLAISKMIEKSYRG